MLFTCNVGNGLHERVWLQEFLWEDNNSQAHQCDKHVDHQQPLHKGEV